MNISCAVVNLLITFVLYSFSFANGHPEMRMEDKVRIREAQNISMQYGEEIWTGINNIPFTVLLITDSVEFLINHPNVSSDFQLIGNDEFLNTDVYYRKRQFQKSFLATFPAVNGVNCIVVGLPENTGRNSSQWVITLLHEHFHQYTFSYPDYYTSVNDLELSGGDETGMWMLDYPFPYKDEKIKREYEFYSKGLAEIIMSDTTEELSSRFSKYKKLREQFKEVLTPSDYKYFSFQLWQEGLARYTEYKFLEKLENYQPSQELIALKDYVSFDEVKEQLYESEIKNIKELKLEDAQRVSFYSTGFAEGILLDRFNPDWRKKYLIEKFFIEQYFPEFK